MFLFIRAQDIQFVTFGLIQDGVLVEQHTYDVPPEQYLASLDEFLQTYHGGSKQVEGIFVVTGPGSFTASRVSVTIANSFAFALKIPVFPIENPEHESLVLLMDRLKNIPDHVFTVPVYDRPPNIT